MKRLILFIALIFSAFFTNAQVNLGMSQAIIGLPDTVNYGDTANIRVYVKNYGPSTFTGDIVLYTAVDTGTGLNITNIDTSLYNTSNFQQGDSLQAVLPQDFSNPQYDYKRNIVVIWPSAINAITQDSVTDSVYVLDPTGVKQVILHENFLKIYPNPSSDELNLQPEDLGKEFFEEIRILDLEGREIRKMKYEDLISLKGLKSGIYYLEIRSKKYCTRIKMIKAAY